MTPIDSSLRNASVVLAGGACLVILLGRFFSPFNGLVPVRGIWMVTQLATPMLCFWCGLLVHYRVGWPKPWLTILTGLLTTFLFWCSRHTVNGPGIGGLCPQYLFLFFLGIFLPLDHIRENGDRAGAKSLILCLLTALSYAALYLVWHRLGNVMKPEHTDMEELILVVTTNVLPLACVLPLLFATEFAFSKAGQWLGSRKWFFWVSLPVAVYCFFGAISSLPYGFWFDFSYDISRWIRFLIQPVTVYLVVVIRRIIHGIASDRIEWKDVFKI